MREASGQESVASSQKRHQFGFQTVGRTFLSALVFSFGFVCLAVRADDEKPMDVKLELLFNGKDLTGFKVPNPNPWWKVVDGVLVGESDAAKKGNVIYTEKSYKDFVLEGDVRFPDDIDSGFIYGKVAKGNDLQVQIGVSRSLKVDMTGSIYYNGKYPDDARAKGVDKLLKLNDWNTMRMEVSGRTTKVWLNGQHVLTFNCPEDVRPGPIGLQIHGGVVMKVEFRNLRIAELK
jgi:hypothetical protein